MAASPQPFRPDRALASLLATGLITRAGLAAPVTDTAVLSTGVVSIDAALPDGGLRRAGLHIFTGAPADPAPLALASVLAGTLDGPIVWIRLQRTSQEQGLPYPYGLAALGLEPRRLLLVETGKAADGFWALEETLRAGCAGAVLAEGLHPDLTQQRRLLLAAERGQCPALLVSSGKAARASAACSQWRIESVPGGGDAAAGMPAGPRWSATLQRCRGARTPRGWIVEHLPGIGLVEALPQALPALAPRPVSAPAEPVRRTG